MDDDEQQLKEVRRHNADNKFFIEGVVDMDVVEMFELVNSERFDDMSIHPVLSKVKMTMQNNPDWSEVLKRIARRRTDRLTLVLAYEEIDHDDLIEGFNDIRAMQPRHLTLKDDLNESYACEYAMRELLPTATFVQHLTMEFSVIGHRLPLLPPRQQFTNITELTLIPSPCRNSPQVFYFQLFSAVPNLRKLNVKRATDEDDLFTALVACSARVPHLQDLSLVFGGQFDYARHVKLYMVLSCFSGLARLKLSFAYLHLDYFIANHIAMVSAMPALRDFTYNVTHVQINMGHPVPFSSFNPDHGIKSIHLQVGTQLPFAHERQIFNSFKAITGLCSLHWHVTHGFTRQESFACNFATLHNLRLTVNDARLMRDVIASLDDCTALTHLRLDGNFANVDTTKPNTRELRTLELGQCIGHFDNIVDVLPLFKCTRFITEFTATYVPGAPEVLLFFDKWFQKTPRLEILFMSWTNVDDSARATFLRHLTNITHITMFDSRLLCTNLPTYAQSMPDLKLVSLKTMTAAASTGMSDAMLQLARTTEIQIIDADEVSNDASLAIMKQMLINHSNRALKDASLTGTLLALLDASPMHRTGMNPRRRAQQ